MTVDEARQYDPVSAVHCLCGRILGEYVIGRTDRDDQVLVDCDRAVFIDRAGLIHRDDVVAEDDEVYAVVLRVLDGDIS